MGGSNTYGKGLRIGWTRHLERPDDPGMTECGLVAAAVETTMFLKRVECEACLESVGQIYGTAVHAAHAVLGGRSARTGS